MIMHIALFTWVPGVSESQVGELEHCLDEMAATIDFVKEYRHGADLGIHEGNLDYGVAAVLENAADLDRYLGHPAHRRIVDDYMFPMIAKRMAVQIAI